MWAIIIIEGVAWLNTNFYLLVLFIFPFKTEDTNHSQIFHKIIVSINENAIWLHSITIKTEYENTVLILGIAHQK